MTDADAHANTDREIYCATNGDSIHVTESGRIGINVGGLVIVNSPREWHRLAERPASYAAGIEDAARWHDAEADRIEKLMDDPRSAGYEHKMAEAVGDHRDHATAIRALAPPAEAVKLETVERAAIKYDDIVIDVPKPGRHHHCFRLAEAFGKDPNDWIEQGFTTSTGRFVDRVEACRIARQAGQIVEKTGQDDLLFSEDVWPNSLPSQLLASHKGEREDG